MPRPSRKSQLIESARDMVLRHGFSATSLEALCDQTGLTKGAFFHYFESKEAFGLELLEYSARLVEEVLAAADFSAEPDARSHLEAYLRFLERMYGRNPLFRDGCLFAIFAFEHADPRSETRRRCKRAFDDWIAAAAKQFDAIFARLPARPAIASRALGEHLLTVIEGALILGRAGAPGMQLKRSLEHFRRYVEQIALLPASGGDARPG